MEYNWSDKQWTVKYDREAKSNNYGTHTNTRNNTKKALRPEQQRERSQKRLDNNNMNAEINNNKNGTTLNACKHYNGTHTRC